MREVSKLSTTGGAALPRFVESQRRILFIGSIRMFTELNRLECRGSVGASLTKGPRGSLVHFLSPSKRVVVE